MKPPERARAPEPDAPDGNGAGTPAADPVEELVFLCLSLAEAEGPGAFEDVLRTHPGDADEVRRRLAILGHFDLMETDRPARTAEVAGIIAGDFRPVRLIGHGAMSEVWLAEQLSLKRMVALKVLRPGPGWPRDARERFRRESELLARVRDPHVVRVHAAGEEEGLAWIAMEFVPGRGLDEILAAGAGSPDAPPLAARLAWLRDIARALHAAHEAGIVHRDVKPSNIRIREEDGAAVLLDFGLARAADLTSMSVPGSFIGSPAYAAPEQVTAHGNVGPAADIHGLGVTLYEAVTGRLPFTAETASSVLARILTREPPPPRAADAAVHRDLDTIVMKCLEKNPRDRYGSAAALAEDLDRFLAHRPILARPAGVVGRARRAARRHPFAAAAAVLISMAAASAAVLFQLQELRHVAELRSERDRAVGAEAEARRNFERADGLVRFMNRELSERLESLGRLDVLDSVVSRTREYFGTLPEELLTRTSMSERVRAALCAGRVHEAAGDLAAAEAAAMEALDLAARHAAGNPGDAGCRADLALAQGILGSIRARRGDPDGAEGILEESIAGLRSLAAASADAPRLRHYLGLHLGALSVIRTRRSEHDAALRLLREEARILEGLLEETPGDEGAAGNLSRCLTRVATSSMLLSLAPEAREAARRARELVEPGAEAHPFDVTRQEQLAAALVVDAQVRILDGRFEDGLGLLHRAQTIHRAMVRNEPRDTTARLALAESFRAEAQPELFRGRTEAAVAALRQARAEFGELLRIEPENREWSSRLILLDLQIGGVLLTSAPGEAAIHVQSALDAADRTGFLAAAGPPDAVLYAEGHSILGRTAAERGDHAEAAARHRRALEVLDALFGGGHSGDDLPARTVSECRRLAAALAASPGPVPSAREEARRLLRRAIGTLPADDGTPPSGSRYRAPARAELEADLAALGG